MKYILTFALSCLCLPGIALSQYALQYGAAVATTGEHIIVGEGRNLLLPGHVFVYSHADEDGWTQTQLLSPGGEIARGFGRAIAADGDQLVIGAPLTNEVYFYHKDASNEWQPQHVLSHEHEGFGSAVAMQGDHVLIATSGNRTEGSAVYAFLRTDDGNWNTLGSLEADESTPGDGFGRALTIHGAHAIVGAPNSNASAGAAYAFRFEDGSWASTGTIETDELSSGDRFGTAVTFMNDALAISAPGMNSGTVLSFENHDGQWTHTRTITPEHTEEDINFGSSTAYTNGRLWVGASASNNRSGSVYLFDMGMDVKQITPADLQFRSLYGSSIAVSEDLAVVGATGYDNFEGVVFPIRRLNDTWQIDPPVFNTESEIASITGDRTECRNGKAGMFPCNEVDMISFLTRQEIGARRGIQVNDVWGWEDPATEREYALVGRTDGTSFIDLSDPYNPRYLGDLPKTVTANQSLWRDIKVYKNHAFIVADGAGAHHMQIFDLTQLRDVTEPTVFTETALYKGIYSSHNIIINEETGYAYAVGNDSGGETCGGALHMINIQDPLNPTFAGCFADTRTGRRSTGATHDAQCVTYNGPDTEFVGHEICLSSNGTALSIADVSDKDNPVALAIAEYPNVAYTHQGWLTEDHRYFYLNDEGDEMAEVVSATRTLIFDVSDLEDPQLAKEYLGPTSAIDHNLYIQGNIMYQTNYVEGLRLIDISDPENPVEIGHFDTVPYGPNDNSPVLGAWSNYPYFKSGVVVVTSGREGVFFLKKRAVDT